MPTPSIQTLINDAQQVLNLDSISAVRSVVAVSLANANTGTPLNPNLTTQQLWNEFYQVVTRSKSDIESIIANQLMKFLYSPPAPGGVGANKQVIFNDNGILAGDAGLTYDKATDSLTISGAANFNGGALAAYLNGSLLVGSFANVVNLYAQSSGLHIKNNTGTFPLLTVNNSGDYTFQDGAGGTRMTLNANGLGIGVTPSAWNSNYNALDIGQNGNISGRVGTSNTVDIVSNGYRNSAGNWVYKLATSNTACRYQLDGSTGAHIWYSGAAGTAGNTIAGFSTATMTLNANGALALQGGNTSANGVGITFPATQVASSDANTLDDYEEGTFTPIVRGSTTSGTGTYTTQFGRYTKVGRLVTVTVTLNWTAHTGTGNLQFAGLPFVSANTASAYDGIAIAYQSNISSAANTVLYGLVEFGSTVVTMTATPVGGGGYGLVAMDTAGEIAFTVTYTV